MCGECYIWILLVLGIRHTISGKPPVITKFPAFDLNQPGNVTSHLGFRLQCTAGGTSPLQYRWQHNGRDIVYGKRFRLLPTGTLIGKPLDSNDDGTYQCFVKNDFGADFSRKLWINVTVLGNFYFEDNKVAPVILGKPIEIPCPRHEPSYGVTYRWGGFNSFGFRPVTEDKRIAVTLDGTLVIMFVTKQDAQKVNSTGGIHCEMAIDGNATYSHAVTFNPIHGLGGSAGRKPPEFYFTPKLEEEAIAGREKKLYCLAASKPAPNIKWTKDGETIEDGKNEFRLPAEHFNRLLIITKVNKAHHGTYTCTAMSFYGSEILQEHLTSFLTVKVAPKWIVELPPKMPAEANKTKMLTCLASADPIPRYYWFRNGRDIKTSNARLKVKGNIIELINVGSWHNAVYQCVAENDVGMNVTSTWVEVQVPSAIFVIVVLSVAATSSERESSGVKWWFIVAAVMGVLLIVAIVVLLTCYKRRKARRNEERPRNTAGASQYNDILDEHQSSQSTPHAKTTLPGPPGVNGLHRRPTLPPLPQYQSLDPTTIGAACYEPLDPSDLTNSGLYERLDFRTLDEAHDYDNLDKDKSKPIPEYLELVSDASAPPYHITSGGAETEKYEPMGVDVPSDAVHVNNPLPSDAPMDIAATNVTNAAKPYPSSSSKYYEPMDTQKSRVKSACPSSPKYYEPMAGNNLNDNSAKTMGSPSSREYYQPMKDNVLSSEKVGLSPQEYYVSMGESSLNNPDV